jgi:hypothetical protein
MQLSRSGKRGGVRPTSGEEVDADRGLLLLVGRLGRHGVCAARGERRRIGPLHAIQPLTDSHNAQVRMQLSRSGKRGGVRPLSSPRRSGSSSAGWTTWPTWCVCSSWREKEKKQRVGNSARHHQGQFVGPLHAIQPLTDSHNAQVRMQLSRSAGEEVDADRGLLLLVGRLGRHGVCAARGERRRRSSRHHQGQFVGPLHAIQPLTDSHNAQVRMQLSRSGKPCRDRADSLSRRCVHRWR